MEKGFGVCWYKEKCHNECCNFTNPVPKSTTVINKKGNGTASCSVTLPSPNFNIRSESENISNSNVQVNDRQHLQTIVHNTNIDVSNMHPLCKNGNSCKIASCRNVDAKGTGIHNPYFTRRETQVINNHNNRISAIGKKLEDVYGSVMDSKENYEENLLEEMNVEILKSQIYQLTTQLEVYNFFKARAYEIFSENVLESIRQVQRELFRLSSSLPVFAKRLEIEKVFEMNPRVVIIQGQTGSGKSTQIPQYVADHPKFFGKRVICTQPRKIACEALATRVAFEYSGGLSNFSTLGKEIGFHVGGRKVVGRDCRIEFVTEGVMLERILRNDSKIFEDVGCIIIDEAHERSITCDILLGSFKKEDPRWKDTLIIVMSATIDLHLFRNYFQNVPVLEIEGSTFPVKTIYEPLEDTSESRIRSAVAKCAYEIHKSCMKEPGDILCFLPGQEDVLVAKSEFECYFSGIIDHRQYLMAKVMVLYGKQEPEQQACIFEKLPENVRKIIFSTDLAETSVTIDGVKFVVDSGVKKEVIYDPKRNISSLKVNAISKSSAIQRAGRCGRTQPGECHRLYSEDDFEKMYVNAAPEIFRRQLSVAVLSLREMNIDPMTFDWITAPSKEALAAAEMELKMLKAIDSDNKSTELGKLISTSQQDPKLVKMIYCGCRNGFGIAAITLASIATVSDIFFWRGSSQETKSESRNNQKKFLLPEGDFVTMYRVFQIWLNIVEGIQDWQENGEPVTDKQWNKKEANDWCMKNSVNGKAMFLALLTRRELTHIFKRSYIWTSSMTQNKEPSNRDLQKIIFSGYFLQTARLIHSRNVNSQCQYYALNSDITGHLSYNSAFLNYSENSREMPQWIIYDRMFRLSITMFPCSSAIEESWLREESPEFYDMCMEKLKSLPTETITKFLSQASLEIFVGRYYSKLESLENELGCSITAYKTTGQLTMFCSVLKKSAIEKSVNEKISKILSYLQCDTVEEEYLGGIRIVIGQGYEIKEILFPQEFTTIYLKNLGQYWNERAVERLLCCTGVNKGVLSIEMTNQIAINCATVKFASKIDAKVVNDRLHNLEFLENENISVYPKLGTRKGVNQGMSSRLKLSWAAGPSTGIATIWFATPEDANSCIENFANIFPAGAVVSIMGDRENPKSSFPQRRSKKPLPPVKTIFIPRLLSMMQPDKKVCRFRFNTEKISEMGVGAQHFEYIVTVSSIPQDADEYEINRRIQSYKPKWVKLRRVSEKTDLSEEEKIKKLSLISSFIEEDGADTCNFYDSQNGRTGIYIYFKSNSLAKEAYNKRICYNIMAEKPHGQPHRLEIEYIHQTSIHVDLFQVLEETLFQFKLDAKRRNVTVTHRIPRHSRSKFVYLNCRTNRQANILWVQEQLNEITSPTKFVSEYSHLLFTWTGKSEMENLIKKTFIHFHRKNNWIWVYGSKEMKMEVISEIENIVSSLSSLQVIDKPIVLNKREVNVTGKEGAQILQFCRANNIPYFRFHGNTLYVTGNESSIEKVETFLEKTSFKRQLLKKFSYEEEKTRECGICFCPCDGKFIVLSLCSHVFCLECIEPMFEQQPPPFPVKCPRCEIPFALNDVLKCAPQGSLLKILEVAVQQFQQKHSTDVRLCPTHGCEQLLSYSSRTTGKFGGEFIFCDECMTTYCIVCSTELCKPVKSHEDNSCEDTQSGLSIEVSKYVKSIQENILNLNCPKCKRPFFDFDGCAAVICDNCRCNFCGLCLQDCGTPEETHSHVRQCPKQTMKNNFYADKKTLDLAHRDLRIQKIKAYIMETPALNHNLSTLKKVVNSLHKDLAGLSIDSKLFMPSVPE